VSGATHRTRPGAPTTDIPFADLHGQHDAIRERLDEAWRQVTGAEAYISGPALTRFEERWAQYCQRRAAVGVGSGTDALELALRAVGIGPGCEVVVPSLTFVATAAAVCATGAEPVYVDVEPDTLLVSARLIAPALTERTAAIVVVHLYGNAVGDFDEIRQLADERGLFLLEDAAQAHGAVVGERPVGSLGDAAAFSFYPSKNLGALGDGGAVVTDDVELAARVRRIGSHGRSGPGGFDFAELGRTSRLDSLQAALLDVKLDHLEAWNERKRRVVDRYCELLPEELRPVTGAAGTRSAPHLCVVRVPDRDAVRASLARAGIATGIHYHEPCHLTRAVGRPGPPLPVSEAAAGTVLSLPLFPHLEDSAVERVCTELVDAVRGR
jgi:dTDP-4-amino-4,6-dideoxygalactose transaminase